MVIANNQHHFLRWFRYAWPCCDETAAECATECTRHYAVSYFAIVVMCVQPEIACALMTRPPNALPHRLAEQLRMLQLMELANCRFWHRSFT